MVRSGANRIFGQVAIFARGKTVLGLSLSAVRKQHCCPISVCGTMCSITGICLRRKEHEAETFEAELAAQGLSFFEQKPIPNSGYHRRIVESWKRIFELHWCEPDLAEPFHRKSIQATVWELSIDQVRGYKHFTSR